MVKTRNPNRPTRFQHRPHHFLGDYCDRGPDTKKVVNFLINLPSKYPYQKHVFLAGNHDFAFAAFVGVVPEPRNGVSFKKDGRSMRCLRIEKDGIRVLGMGICICKGGGAGSIEVRFNTVKETEFQGSIYDAGPTFASYGVPHGSAGGGLEHNPVAAIILHSMKIVRDTDKIA